MTAAHTAPLEDLIPAEEEHVLDWSVHRCLNAAMRAVTFLGKGEVNSAPGQGNYRYRGIDQVINALGPQFRRFHLVVVPRVTDREQTLVVVGAKRSEMASVRVTVEYTIYGPQGDSIVGGASGEAFDSGDKATSKAMSVALRTFLLQVFALPTDDPDPDSTSYERASSAPQGPARVENLTTRLQTAGRAENELPLRKLWDDVVASGNTEDQAVVGDYIRQWQEQRAAADEKRRALAAQDAVPPQTDQESADQVRALIAEAIDTEEKAGNVAELRKLMAECTQEGETALRDRARAALVKVQERKATERGQR